MHHRGSTSFHDSQEIMELKELYNYMEDNERVSQQLKSFVTVVLPFLLLHA